MGAIFGKGSKKLPISRVTEQDKAVLQLKHQRDQVKVYQKRIEQSMVKDRELARKCLNTGRKERAKLLLRKKKYQEKLLENTDVQLENLEKLTSDIEFAQIEQQVLDGLKTGNAALKKVHDVLNIDEIERIMDETQESVEKQREIDDILSGVLTQEDEDDVMAELDALVEADENADVITQQLPDVPSEDLPEIEENRAKASKQKKVMVEA